MPCFHPLTAFHSASINPASGKRGITFKRSEAFTDLPEVKLPCGNCVGCRLDRSREWGSRIMHENSLWPCSSFVTLTFAPEHLPENGVVEYEIFQNFMKRLRKHYEGVRIRFFVSFEYGEMLSRPHFHVILFNLDFREDRVKSGKNHLGQFYFRSATLERLWGLGRCTIGEVTQESAAYCARYIMKKITGEAADDHYKRVNVETGEVVQVPAEYVRMSRRPGIGAGWFSRFKSDVFPDDFVLSKDGDKSPVPAYYDRLLDREDPQLLKRLKRKRMVRGILRKEDSTPERLAVRKTILLSRVSRLKRDKV